MRRRAVNPVMAFPAFGRRGAQGMGIAQPEAQLTSSEQQYAKELAIRFSSVLDYSLKSPQGTTATSTDGVDAVASLVATAMFGDDYQYTADGPLPGCTSGYFNPGKWVAANTLVQNNLSDWWNELFPPVPPQPW